MIIKKQRVITLVILVSWFGYNNVIADTDTQGVPIVAAVGTNKPRIELNQGWSQQIRQKFWFTSQGARILPYTWFMWLEQVDSTELFRSVDHMDSLRYLPMQSSALNPAGLPIGFALDKDRDSGRPWVGLTCSACHTNQIDYQGVRMLIEGAPTLANFAKFYSKLVQALNQTEQNDARFTRFAKKVLADDYSIAAAKQLHEQLAEVTFNLAQRQQVNALPADYPIDFYGYARLDAFGNIQNAASAFALHDVSNKNSPTAPVSYPFLWGTHQSDVVQWNGSAPNTPVIGPLVRNMGEVVGVFGGLSMEKASWWSRLFGKKIEYSSTVNMHNLGLLEKWVKDLRSPRWSETSLPAVNLVKAATGSVIYQDQCASCHQVIPPNKEGEKYKSSLISLDKLNTDPAMAVNAAYHMSNTLILEGVKSDIIFGEKFAATSPSIDLATNGIVGLVLEDPVKALEAGLIPSIGRDRGVESNKRSLKDLVKEHVKKLKTLKPPANTTRSVTQEPDLGSLVYKARPLNGIWATAPYFHNGSVPNLWELMRRAEDRTVKFLVGSREYDPVNVGFETDKGLSVFSVYKAGTNIIQPGNSNLGHDYGTDLSDEQKWAVIEYMKTL